MTTQWTFNEHKELLRKHRLTHDLSINQSDKNSINSCLLREQLPELHYGWFLSRILHYIHALGWAAPQVPILINKIYAKAAYRRCALRGMLAAMSITTLDD